MTCDVNMYVQIKGMDGDKELGIAHMQHDVKLIFRGGQAAGVPFHVLQRAAARFTQLMVPRPCHS